jgi:hypothetical protein
MREDYCQETEDERKKLYPYLRSAKIKGAKATIRGTKLIINGKAFTSDTLYQIPDALTPAAAATRDQGDIILFFSKESVFSNFHKSPFTIDNVQYEHNEQYIQSKNAEHFAQDDTAHKILFEPNLHIVQEAGISCQVQGGGLACSCWGHCIPWSSGEIQTKP